jgi:GH18 family chitinase
MIRYFTILLLVCTVTSAHDVIGYLPSYRVNQASLKSLAHCTDVCYFGSTLGPDGSIHLANHAATHLGEIRKAISVPDRDRKCRLILCLGGWKNDKHFPAVTSSPLRRKQFSRSLEKLVIEYQLDGVDLDWEYPEDEAQWRNLGELLAAGKSAIRKRPFLWSIAVNPGHKVPVELASTLDRIHLMTYDSGPKHCAPQVAGEAVKSWKKLGFSADKLCIGAAFYGRKTDQPGDVKTYAEIFQKYGREAQTTPTAGGYFYDDPAAIKTKKQMVIQSGLRGIIVWEIGQDAPGDAALLPLLK